MRIEGTQDNNKKSDQSVEIGVLTGRRLWKYDLTEHTSLTKALVSATFTMQATARNKSIQQPRTTRRLAFTRLELSQLLLTGDSIPNGKKPTLSNPKTYTDIRKQLSTSTSNQSCTHKPHVHDTFLQSHMPCPNTTAPPPKSQYPPLAPSSSKPSSTATLFPSHLHQKRLRTSQLYVSIFRQSGMDVLLHTIICQVQTKVD